GPRVVE
nr:Chain G, GLY-PRO-ARG-VAL-VAL-GLU peptide [synthetic construct]2FFD_H Chain H, GLY-PRO-ARG-VAL-VAL-GLU peptide [synthetic construct]2FFD_I Chain I, GLY-PRO-ARG-VAL-VAL-GLU peptide [synthetic construct]2FFD_J Chain J, GLY-PRO-ARG-VAL-VAL-GLU peptide [synthetic construct]